MEEKFEKILLDNTIFNKNEFMAKYNPWAQERATHLINNYLMIMNKENESNYFTGDFNYNSENFSWLAIEEDLENKYLKTGKAKEFPKNIHYGLPNQIHGNIDKSTIFQCLLNPNIAIIDKKTEPENLEDFFDEFESTNTGDLSAKFLNYSNEEKIKKHIVDTDSSMLSKELLDLINLDESKFKELMSGVKKLTNRFYYLGEYFYPLLASDNENNKVFQKLKKELGKVENYNIVKENVEKLKTCNLEVFPFRSKEPKLGFGNNNFGRDLVETEVDSILLGARIILRRIALYLQDDLSNNVQPIFIFRRYDLVWKNLIMTVLKNDYKVNNEDAKEMLKEMEDEYFYFFTNRSDKGRSSGKISKGNLKKSDNSVSERQSSLKKDEFLDLKIKHGTLILENNEI
ncbi:hypothetical protein [Staphylococcus sp. GDY8P57P]|uniref:hypothetical protein n=1 Tax=Staphylococcus sp. GDY8P57P TaxID=2804128 RepID=UPI0018823DB8|nr:hypothetical protein [Staphylococcus sp. GDY8P57P]MBF2756509.1 hypothetical protein [Staphylococcus haemolyticus]MBF2773757.1 hypothetical protein [Staphylococcus haemolyticus]MBF2775873.1 hypothetical protein [Staphylococcus haemolyticus]MBF2815442.1 hypothetical protein [Staphylococcus haemolyticus]MBF9719784.1 hypothetical protein [Staphylococcus haemolyticus]